MPHYSRETPNQDTDNQAEPCENRASAQIARIFSGVETVSINALTGSIIINYSDCTTSAESILDILREKGYYHISQEEQPERAIETVVSRVGTTVGKFILGAAVEKAFEGSMLSLLAFLV